jgi:hypothetical protein
MKSWVVLLCMVAISGAAQAAGQPQRGAPAPAPVAEAQPEAQALRQDIAQMRVLLHQMELNLALVQTTQSPLKHQFDLEIEMWRVVLNGMERRVEGLQRPTTGGVGAPGTVPLRRDSGRKKP